MFNTEQRTLAKNEFEKDFFKLMSNACFGKTMENLRNRVDMDFVTSNALWGDHATKMPRTLERKLASPLYNGHVVYNADLAAIKKKKQLLTLNKPIYAGMAILDLSKLHMFEFHYDIILPRYKENAQLLFTDTDSLCYLIKTDDFYKDMLASKDLYDMSNFPRDSPFYDASKWGGEHVVPAVFFHSRSRFRFGGILFGRFFSRNKSSSRNGFRFGRFGFGGGGFRSGVGVSREGDDVAC
eukprot:COSAG01_NODE_17390_length_1155_cov_2.418561_1_plen_238_part_01